MPALKKILCALDLSDQSESVAEYAVMLAKMSGASIVAVYAAPTLTQYTGFHVPPNTIDNFVGEIVSGAERSMTDFVSEHFTGVDARGVVVVGYAAEEILALAEKAGLSDWNALATRSLRTFVARLHQQGQGVKAGALPLGAGAKMAERVVVAGIEGIAKGAHLDQYHGGPQINDIVEHGGNIC